MVLASRLPENSARVRGQNLGATTVYAFGQFAYRSEDGGTSWKVTRLTKGKMDDWAANDLNFAKMIGWTDEPLPFTDAFAQIWSLGYAHGTLYAGHQTSEPSGK